jgi:hypothetical protein
MTRLLCQKARKIKILRTPFRADTGAVTLIQRFGSAANLNIHLHCLVLDGVYLNRDGAAVFHEAAAPTVEELEVLLAKIITRPMRILTRLGALIEEQDQTYLAETDTDGALKSLQAALCPYRIALGARAGQKVLSLQSLPSRARPSDPDLRVNAHGFSLHAALRWRADQRKELEQLCRYITRPAIANERLKRNRAGQGSRKRDILHFGDSDLALSRIRRRGLRY